MIKIFIYMIIFCDIYKKEMHVHTSNTPPPPPNKSILAKKICSFPFNLEIKIAHALIMIHTIL